MGIACTGCSKGVSMCYKRPCWGSPEDFDKILDAGFADKVQSDWYYRKSMGDGQDIAVLSMGVYPESDAEMYNDPSNPFSALLLLLSFHDPKPWNEKEYSTEHTGGKQAFLNPSGKCVMLTEDDLCGLHDLGLKPEQGQAACCKKENDTSQDNVYYANLWDTDYGRSVVEKWKTLNNKN